MGIASTVRDFLDQSGVEYELIHHLFSRNSRSAARAAQVPEEQVAKPVLLEDADGFVLAVVPASRRVELGHVEQRLGRKLTLASERELRGVFSDCRKGAMPALGQAYGVKVVWDDCLAASPDIYFDAGDHTDLVHISGQDFTFGITFSACFGADAVAGFKRQQRLGAEHRVKGL